VPGAGWDRAKQFLDEAARRGAAIFSLLRNHPFDRAFDLAQGTALYAGVPAWHAWMGLSRDEKLARLRDPEHRAALRHAVEHPNRDPDAGSTLPPPRWEVVFVDEVADPKNELYLRRSIAEIAAERGVAPADAMLDLALEEQLATRFRFENKTLAWEQAVRESMKHPSILIGVSDGGAHLDRDDGAEWSSHFLRFWVLERGEWTLEEGIRQLTQVPAALAGFADRGALLPGFAADLFIFDPETVNTGEVKLVDDLPGGTSRLFADASGVHRVIVNGTTVVADGTPIDVRPGTVLRSGRDTYTVPIPADV